MSASAAGDGDPAEGFASVTVGSPSLQATFVPDAGMVCCSLRHDGQELLARRKGLRAYARQGSTMGIPLLYPWANRLAGTRYPGPHGDVSLEPANPLLKFDADGLPIHGAIAGELRWELIDAHAADDDSLRARLSWKRPDLLAIFPFEHELQLAASITGTTLTIETSVATRRDGPVPVPVSFGYHPYLTLPVAREEWRVELPRARRLLLDDRMIPTGVSESFASRQFELSDGDWDDAFAGLCQSAEFAVSGAGRRIALRLAEGYSHAQVYSPAGASFICFEPMTAPANALISRDALPVVAPGRLFRAEFAITATHVR
jgi:aldose 1-epimerase